MVAEEAKADAPILGGIGHLFNAVTLGQKHPADVAPRIPSALVDEGRDDNNDDERGADERGAETHPDRDDALKVVRIPSRSSRDRSEGTSSTDTFTDHKYVKSYFSRLMSGTTASTRELDSFEEKYDELHAAISAVSSMSAEDKPRGDQGGADGGMVGKDQQAGCEKDTIVEGFVFDKEGNVKLDGEKVDETNDEESIELDHEGCVVEESTHVAPVPERTASYVSQCGQEVELFANPTVDEEPSQPDDAQPEIKASWASVGDTEPDRKAQMERSVRKEKPAHGDDAISRHSKSTKVSKSSKGSHKRQSKAIVKAVESAAKSNKANKMAVQVSSGRKKQPASLVPDDAATALSGDATRYSKSSKSSKRSSGSSANVTRGSARSWGSYTSASTRLATNTRKRMSLAPSLKKATKENEEGAEMNKPFEAKSVRFANASFNKKSKLARTKRANRGLWLGPLLVRKKGNAPRRSSSINNERDPSPKNNIAGVNIAANDGRDAMMDYIASRTMKSFALQKNTAAQSASHRKTEDREKSALTVDTSDAVNGGRAPTDIPAIDPYPASPAEESHTSRGNLSSYASARSGSLATGIDEVDTFDSSRQDTSYSVVTATTAATQRTDDRSYDDSIPLVNYIATVGDGADGVFSTICVADPMDPRNLVEKMADGTLEVLACICEDTVTAQNSYDNCDPVTKASDISSIQDPIFEERCKFGDADLYASRTARSNGVGASARLTNIVTGSCGQQEGLLSIETEEIFSLPNDDQRDERGAVDNVTTNMTPEKEPFKSPEKESFKSPKRFGLRMPSLKRKKKDNVIDDDFMAGIMDELLDEGFEMEASQVMTGRSESIELPQDFSDLIADAIKEETGLNR